MDHQTHEQIEGAGDDGQIGDLRHGAQPLDHRAEVGPGDGGHSQVHRHRPTRRGPVDVCGIATDDAETLETCDPLADGRSGEADLPGERTLGQARVSPEQPQQPIVELVQTDRLGWCVDHVPKTR